MFREALQMLLAQVDSTPSTATGGLYFALWCALVAAGTAGAAALTWWLGQKAIQSKGWQAVGTLWELAQSIVAHVEVHIRPTIRTAVSDGKLTPAEALQIKAEALKLFKEAAGPALLASAQKFLHASAPAFEVYLSGILERALGLQRASGTLPPPAPGSTVANVLAPATAVPTMPR